MKRKAHPTRIGLFMLGALALLVAAVVVVSGGRVFANRERAVAYFDGSVYGLQLGWLRVVFRGVAPGVVWSASAVKSTRASRDAMQFRSSCRSIPTPSPTRRPGTPGAMTTVADLVGQGLNAQLSTQSPSWAADVRPRPAQHPGPAGAQAQRRADQIPTLPTTLQSLQKQLQNVDRTQLLGDVSAVAAGLRQLVGNPKLAGTARRSGPVGR